MMDSSPGGSFIPKRNATKRRPRPKIGRRVYLFSYVAYIFFFGTLLSVVGIFLLNQQAQNTLAENVEQLELAQKDFDRNSIRTVTILDNRLKMANSILDSHVTLLPIFEQLEATVAASVKLSQFEYSHEGPGNIMLMLSGEASDFNAILAQRMVFSENQLFEAVQFSDIAYSTASSEDQEALPSTSVSFSLAHSFSEADLAYQNNFADTLSPVTEPSASIGSITENVTESADSSITENTSEIELVENSFITEEIIQDNANAQ